ncbi:MAG: hypothetical protein LBE38_03855 [Deltaproteobacteria bacterium]|jgi:hypothetical protein|nr:hypothetical protein [Deltaproteobacteria bacterium]
MTQPLHLMNQIILNLPPIGTHVAAQVQVGEEIARQERMVQAENYYRDTVEIVTQANETYRVNPVHPDPDDRNRASYRPHFTKRTPKEQRDPFIAPFQQVIDRRI